MVVCVLGTPRRRGDGKKKIAQHHTLLQKTGIDMLTPHANVDCSYDLTPEALCAKISLCDAIIVRSGTKVGAFGWRRRMAAAGGLLILRDASERGLAA